MSLIIPANSAVGGGFEVANSLRFNDDSSDYLNRTPSGAGDRRTFTISTWVKRGNLGDKIIFAANTQSTSNGYFAMYFSGDAMRVRIYEGSAKDVVTSAVFRDVSAWYHFVVAIDTTQSTSSDRVKIYVNGSEADKASGSYTSQNFDTSVNNTVIQQVGVGRNSGGSLSNYFDGYMTETVLVDGTALDPTSFGEFDENSGIWKPIDVSGLTFGTNGFYLDFENSGSLGADVSGNTNNFTVNNLTAIDQTTDTPTNNFATLNILRAETGGTTTDYSEGNTKVVNPSSSNSPAIDPTILNYEPFSGSLYAEFLMLATGTGSGNKVNTRLELQTVNQSSDTAWLRWRSQKGGAADGVGDVQQNTGSGGWTNVANSTDLGYVANDIVAIAFDFSNNQAKFFKNGTLVHTYSYSGTLGTMATLRLMCGKTGGSWVCNYGQDSSFAGNKTKQTHTDVEGYGNFQYSAASNHHAICSKNAPKFTNTTIDKPLDYFNTKLYTGDDTNNRQIALDWSPDLTWIKARNVAYSHLLFDRIRGLGFSLSSNNTNADRNVGSEFSWSNSGCTTDSFTVDRGSNESLNESGRPMVAWNWLAGGTASSNTDGSITSSVSANQDAGFSIVSYTGNGTDNATIGHGLGIKPDCLIVKNRDDGADGWGYWNKGMGAETQQMALNMTNAAFTDDVFKSSSSTTVTLGTDTWSNVNTEKYIMYAFAEKQGYSKFGSYTGNGSTDGAFVYTGFKPAWFMIKRTNSTESWYIHDNKRDTFNPSDKHLLANSSNAENPQEDIDLLSNGIKIRSTDSGYNASGSTYIYMAFAENPFVTSTGIPATAR